MVRALPQQGGIRILGTPLPDDGALPIQQGQPVQVHEARPVGQVQAQMTQRSVVVGQCKAQCLTCLANDAGGGELALFLIAASARHVELGREQRMPLGVVQRRLDGQRLGGGRCTGDELVGQCIGRGQQVACNGRGQAVVGDAEFRFGKGALDGVDVIDLPALLGQKARQRAPREKAQVGAVQQAFFAVAEFAVQQFCHQAAVACVGYGDQQTAFRRQPLAAGSQDALGLAQVLEHIGTDDVVIARVAEELVQVAVLQVGHMDMAVEGRGMACLFLAQGDAVADALLVLGEKGAQRAAAAAQIQYVRLGPDMAGQHGQRRALVQIDGAQVDVGIGNGCGHRK